MEEIKNVRWQDGAIASARGGPAFGWRWFIIVILWSATAYAAPAWKDIADGLQYKKVNVSPAGFIHFFKIDPAKLKLKIITAKEFGMINIDAKSMAQKSGSIAAVNGGFFTPEYASLGLLVKDGREISRLKWTSWWHIFQIASGKPRVITKQDYKFTPEIEMAIEAGPRILVDGSVPSGLKQSAAERTAIGIADDGSIILAVTESLPITLSDFAVHLLNIGCKDALNLDGGSSTQVYAKAKGFELYRNGFGPVANGIGVFPR